MIKLELYIYNLIVLISYILLYVQCQTNLKDDYKQKEENFFDYTIEPGKVKLKYLNDSVKQSINFSEEINDDLLVNLYSPSGDIFLNSYNNQSVSLIYKSGSSISMKIKNKSFKTAKIILMTKPYLINDNPKYYNIRLCPLAINTIEVNKFTLLMEEKEPTFLYFYENFTQIILSYNLTELIEKSSVTLSFSFNNITKFNINISDIIDTTISNSTTIFLDSESLSKITDKILNIHITHIENKNCSLIFQIIEPNSIYFLQKNNLNKGFITSNYLYQYYYMQVLEEEGEIILHNKRNIGKLFGVIKEHINPYNISEYLKNEEDNKLEFNEHTRKLSFNSKNTSHCKKGCYLLITYYNENYDINNPIINYEYTIYSRIWDVEDEIPQIINIPINEFIFGTFEDGSFINHYYSTFIPNETQKLVIQIQSNHIEGFIGKGKKKLITSKKKTNTDLNITMDKINVEFQKNRLKELGYLNSEISFAFRSKNYFEKIFSFYYFRLSILKDDEKILIYPFDSNVGNNCAPEKENNSYFCYFLLSNNYKQFNLNFSVSTSIQEDNYTIYYYYNNIEYKSKYLKYYLSNANDKDLQSIIFKYEFQDNKIKTILSSFNNMKDLTYPQIFSSQIYFFSNSSKKFNFAVSKRNCLLIFKHIYGKGVITFDKYPKIVTDLNFIGKPITIPNSEVTNISFHSEEDFFFYLKLKSVDQNLDIKEIYYNESLNDLFFNTQFPIYYYIKYNNQDNLELIFRIMNIEDNNTTTDITDIDIKGYILNKNILNRRLNGEFIQLNQSIDGHYDKGLKNGILQINNNFNEYNKNNIQDDIYIFIKIDGKHYINNYLSVEIMAMPCYLVPVNQYIMGSFNSSKNITYLIRNNIIDNNKDSNFIIEFSPNYEEIKFNFDNSKGIYATMDNITKGIQKYRINATNFKEIYLNINKPEKIPYGKFLFRYYFTKENEEFEYKFNELSYEKKYYKENDTQASICLEFDTFEIFFNKKLVNHNLTSINETDKYNKNLGEIKLKIHGSLFKNVKENNQFKELLNTAALISSEISYENVTGITYNNDNKFNLCFRNMSRKDFKYDMQIKINIIFSDYLFNKDSLVYALPVDFTEEFKDKNIIMNFIKNYFIFLIIIAVIIIVLLIFIIYYFKLKKKNKSLEKRVLSTSFTFENNDETFDESQKRKETTNSEADNPFI